MRCDKLNSSDFRWIFCSCHSSCFGMAIARGFDFIINCWHHDLRRRMYVAAEDVKDDQLVVNIQHLGFRNGVGYICYFAVDSMNI